MIYSILNIIMIILYSYLFINAIYLLIFSISSYFYKPLKKISKSHYNKFAILIPAYKEDKVINDCINSVISSEYNISQYDTFVISDQMDISTNNYLRAIGINVIEVHYEESSKAKALKTAMKYINDKDYDYVIIIDADNIIPTDYLSNINKYINTKPFKALQTHRQAKNINNSLSLLDAVIEETNNTIFRQGHAALNISSALIGSGMVFEFKWFKDNVNSLCSAGEDKELEEMLLKQQIFIEYDKDITFKDEKTDKKTNINNQRRRWLSTQFYMTMLLLPNLLTAIKEKKRDYILKTIESIILPRSILIALLSLISIMYLLFNPIDSIRWIILLLLIIISLYIAIPSYMRNSKLIAALINVPFFIIMMIINLFRLKGISKKFIHTEHGESI